MATSKRIFSILGGLALLIVIAAGISIYVVLENSLPPQNGELHFTQLNHRVEITYDAKGIPQIWAQNEHDGYFAMGYLHASDRLFQMDMTRRVAQGRLADLLGPTVLNIDIHQRTVGHDRIAKQFVSALSDENRARLQAYADGINAYVKTCDALPFEFTLLQKEFTPWSVYDCVSVFSFQTWFSDYLMSPDAFLTKVSDRAGYEKARSLNIPYPKWAPFCTPPDLQNHTGVSSVKETLANALFGEQDLPFRMANSSNSWVIAPFKSKSGKAMLASDPHLETTRLPQFWYYLGWHIKETQAHVLGITTPGLPFVTMGHNTKAAWAFTVSGVDVNEYYHEKINNERNLYLSPEGWKALTVLPQEIRISGQEEPYRFTVRLTGHGPLVFENDSLHKHYSLHWAGYDVDLNASFSAGFHLAYTSDFEEFRQDVTRFGALDANWTYADVKGNIGYQLGTPVAIRPADSGNLPVPGWTHAYDWQGFRPLEQTPHAYNPPHGWLATCNNKQDESHLSYKLIGNFASDRILRINQLLSSKKQFSVQDMYDFQMDITDAYLLRWKDILLPLLKKGGYDSLITPVQNWNGSMATDSREAALFSQFINRLRHLTFDDELGKQSSHIGRTDMEAVYRHGPAEWFDDIRTKQTRETRETIALRALSQAVTITGNKTWGDFQTLTMQHPLAVVPGVSTLLHLKHGPFPWAGSPGTLNASFYFEDSAQPNHFLSTVGPSWRFVIDFNDVNAATMALPAGNSGNPLSPHFMDFFDWWKTGRRWNVPADSNAVYARAQSVLVLRGAHD